jgi:hypothetical protein
MRITAKEGSLLGLAGSLLGALAGAGTAAGIGASATHAVFAAAIGLSAGVLLTFQGCPALAPAGSAPDLTVP